ncbi:Hsp70 family protein [Mycobacterium sp. 1274761.0]|uniref:Hsp70 family protein n=1 Tax=Mycobacterium sp. 1274761.0 TaxID=1834077 RepID=UPI0007FE6831|nr:Hsp70 family protein [Mycobacterium sp. 1274761.0]OBK72937.1 molecular chaperone [Mycobacterium sp. 1274761.0]
MADSLGLSVGATNLTAVVVGRAAVTRSSVVTLFPDRPLEVGVPGENPRLTPDDRGVVITDFVDRVGDPVGIVAADGTTHRGEALLAQALRALLYDVTNGRGTTDPVVVTHPAHWRPASVDALRGALAPMREFSAAALVSDAAAAVTALRDDPGLPASGIVALCDFGGSGSSITLVDAGTGRPVGQTVRHTDLSGDLIDQAVLTQVLEGLSDAGAVDATGTSAIGPLSRLRGQCRAAKERLSTTTATSLTAELPGHRGEVRLTRNELDEAIRPSLADFVGVLQETLDRDGARGLAAVASVGGGSRIPLITTTLSEHFGVPVITGPHPELTAAIGGGLTAARGVADVGATAMAEALSPPTAAAAAAVVATQMAPEVHPDAAGSAPSSGLAWSEADDVPDVVPVTDPYDYAGAASTDAMGGPRPPMYFEPETQHSEADGRRPYALLIAGLILVLLAVAFAVWFVLRSDESAPSPSPVTTTTTTAAVPPPTSEAPPPPGETPAPPPPQMTETVTRAPETVTQAPPPPQTSEAPPPPPPTSEAPPPTSEAPSTPPRLIPTLPYQTIPGLPFVPRPIQPPQPAP